MLLVIAKGFDMHDDEIGNLPLSLLERTYQMMRYFGILQRLVSFIGAARNDGVSRNRFQGLILI